MNFRQWLRQTFAPRPQARRARPARARCLPRVEPLEDRFSPAVLTVNSLLDNSPAGDGIVTLREAVNAGQGRGRTDLGATGTGDDVIRFAPQLDGGTITLTSFRTDLVLGNTAILIRNTKLVFDGETGLTRGITIARDATRPPFRFLWVDNQQGNPNVAVTLQGLTVSGFTAQGADGGRAGGRAGGGGGGAGMGGAIFNRGAELTIINSTLTGNTAQGGNGGISPGSSSGGGGGGGGMDSPGGAGEAGNVTAGLLNLYGGGGGGPNGGHSDYRATVFESGTGEPGGFGGGGAGGFADTQFGLASANSGFAGGFGGGGGGGGQVFNPPSNSAFLPNYNGPGVFGAGGGAGGFGAGSGGSAGNERTIRPTIAGFGGGLGGASNGSNGGGGGGGAGLGGAIFNEAGTVFITNSTIAGNAARGGIGGASTGTAGANGSGAGGGVFNHNGVVSLFHVTVARNTAAEGRGVYNRGDAVVTPGSTSTTATAEAFNTIIDDFVGTQPGFPVTGQNVTRGRNNLIQTAIGFAGGVVSTADPNLLNTLQNNGGRTATLALLPGSPAINAGFRGNVFQDQRGVPRDATPDIGAFEYDLPLQSQEITFNGPAPRTLGAADFQVSAQASSGLPVSFTASGQATVYQAGDGRWFIRLLGAGTATITASQAGNSFFSPAFSRTRTLTINKGTLTYEATPVSRLYGADNPVFTGRVTGFAFGDTQAAVTTGTLAFTTFATASSPADRFGFPITGGGLTDRTGNYSFAQSPGNASALTILAVTTANLQATLATQSSVTLRVQPAEADGVVRAINALAAQSAPRTITLNLTGGTYGGVTVSPRANITVVIVGTAGSTTFVGRSPAFTVAGGDVRVENVTFTTGTPSPTILVTGGKMTLRHDEIFETPRFNDPAIMITGGSLDMGTANDPGDNHFHGHGNFLSAVDPRAVTVVVGDFDIDGRVVAGSVPTTTTLSTNSATTAFGQGVRITARVVPWDGGTPTGTVHFFDVTTKTDLGRVPLTLVGGVGLAAFTTAQLSIGGHEIRATYEGDGTFIPSEAVVDQTVVVPVRVAGNGPGAAPVVTVSSGGAADFQITAFDPDFTGGVNAVVLPLDGRSQVVAGAGPGGGPLVKVFDVASGSLVREVMAFDPDFRGGVTVAAGSLGDDAIYVVAAGPGGGPHVKVYDARDGSLLSSFFAYDTGFTGGVNVAVGDVNGDGRLDVVTGAGPGGGPQVSVFDAATGQLLRSFFAFDPGFMGGVSVAVGDADLDGRDDIAAGAGPGGGPAVAVFDGPSGAPRANFFAYDQETTAGVLVAWTDLDNAGAGVLGVGQAPRGGDPHVFNALTGQNVDELFEDALLDGSGLFAGAV